MASGQPSISYVPIRGRAEPLRLILAAKDIHWQENMLDAEGRKQMKNDVSAFHFFQMPTYTTEDGHHICQSQAIGRYLGRQHSLYGGSHLEAAYIDEILDGVEALKLEYLGLIYKGQLQEQPKSDYWKARCDASTIHERNGGAHFWYLEEFLKRNDGGQQWVVGKDLSIADIFLYDLVDMQMRIFPEFKTQYPLLSAHHGRVEAIPKIKEYRSSDRCFEQQNGNRLG